MPFASKKSEAIIKSSRNGKNLVKKNEEFVWRNG